MNDKDNKIDCWCPTCLPINLKIKLEKLQDENANLKERIFMKTTLVDSLRAENSKLRECVEFYSVSHL
jgi:hypothetical protein